MNKAARAIIVFCLLVLTCCGRSEQNEPSERDGRSEQRLTILCYNVENLFDDRAEGNEYEEYSGSNWDEQLFERKLSAVARVIKAAAPKGPDILALQEVESLAALQALRDRHLAGAGYRYLSFAGQQGSVTTVACLSRLPVSRTRVHATGRFAGIPLRPILEVQLACGERTLYLFNNHWKSKSEGVRFTEAGRLSAARVLAARIEGILLEDGQADILVAGDLNEDLDEYDRAGGRYLTALVPVDMQAEDPNLAGREGEILFVADRTERAGNDAERLVLYDCWYELSEGERGSSVYQGRWQTPDHILLSGGLFDERGLRYSPGDFRVVKKGFLLDPESGFPKRWRGGGGSSQADLGYSDHLPLLISLEISD